MILHKNDVIHYAIWTYTVMIYASCYIPLDYYQYPLSQGNNNQHVKFLYLLFFGEAILSCYKGRHNSWTVLQPELVNMFVFSQLWYFDLLAMGAILLKYKYISEFASCLLTIGTLHVDKLKIEIIWCLVQFATYIHFYYEIVLYSSLLTNFFIRYIYKDDDRIKFSFLFHMLSCQLAENVTIFHTLLSFKIF